jgi:hypothetical protein
MKSAIHRLLDVMEEEVASLQARRFPAPVERMRFAVSRTRKFCLILPSRIRKD